MIPLDAWLASLDSAQLARLAQRYRTLARAGGAYVLLGDGAEVAIPPVLTPRVVGTEARTELARASRLLVAATDRIARDLLRSPESELARRILAPLSPYERAALERTPDVELATARVDYLLDPAGKALALEINTTIPAMQGYSDAVAGAWLRAVGEQRGLGDDEIERTVDTNGRNSDDLLRALLALHERAGGGTTGQRIAVVARPGDSQSGELDHYVRRWSALGHHAFRCTPDEVSSDARVRGQAVDLFYRHVFLRRLDPQGTFAALLRDPRRHHVWNPPASHLELKAMLGLLSAAAGGTGLLDDDERHAVQRHVPWTRVCAAGATTGPDGRAVRELSGFVLAHPEALVLKRSWDYGGRGVFLGAELESDGSQAKLRALLGDRARPWSWDELVASAFADEAWVVQALVDVQPARRLCVTDAGVEERELYADVSAFTSLGNDVAVEGGAVRAAPTRIVNIQGGGGLVPLIREEALGALGLAQP